MMRLAMEPRIFKSGARAEKVSSNLHWSFPFPVAPWATAFALNSRAISMCAFAISGRAIDVPEDIVIHK
jgi:hypothetical protein